jgi:hypothetical protein
VTQVSLPNTLSAEEWRCLAQFKRRVVELRGAQVFAAGTTPRAHVESNDEVGFRVSVSGMPEEEAWRSLLLTFRFFCSQNEPAHFHRVVNILRRHSTHDELRVYLGHLNDRWKGALFRSAMFLHFGNGVVDAERILDLWLNAHYFHSDEEKQQELDALLSALTPDLTKYMLVDAVMERSRVVLMLGAMLDHLDCQPSDI